MRAVAAPTVVLLAWLAFRWLGNREPPDEFEPC